MVIFLNLRYQEKSKFGAYLDFGRGEHASLFAVGDSELYTNVSFYAHSCGVHESRIDSQMDWIVALSSIILVDNRGMISDFFAGRPPSDDIFLSVYSVIEIVEIHGVIEFSFDLVIGFFVWDAEAICHFDDTLFRTSCFSMTFRSYFIVYDCKEINWSSSSQRIYDCLF